MELLDRNLKQLKKKYAQVFKGKHEHHKDRN